MEKQLPHNIEAECGVLGSIIIDPEALVQVADFLHPDDFYRHSHQSIYEAMCHLFERREPPDFITLCDELERCNKLEDVGGDNYITSLINDVPTSSNVEYYGRIVERNAILRRLIHAGSRIVATAYEETDADVALQSAQSLIFAIGQEHTPSNSASLAEIMRQYMDHLEAIHAQKGALLGVTTGYRLLNKVLGGWQRATLNLIAARPAIGKTAFALNLAMNATQAGHRVGVFSLEMSQEELAERLMSMQSGIDSQLLRNGRIEDDQWEMVTGQLGVLSEQRMWIDDTAALSIMELRTRALRWKMEHDIDLLIVDYLQLLHALVNGKRPERRIEVSEVSAGLKALAKELNIPVIALSQLSRKVEERQVKTPLLSDLREDGSLEQDSDVVLFLYRDEVYHPDSERKQQADVIVAKHRKGPVGEVTLHWDATHTRFTDMEMRYEQ